MIDIQRRRRHRFILLWIVGTGLWISAMLITQVAIRPAPSFYVMAPLVFGGPTLALVLGFAVLWWRARP